MPGEVTLAHQLGKDFMPVTGGSQVAYVLLEAKPTELMAQVRMPLNFSLVLDHSGSMKRAKLKNVKEAVKMVIDRLVPTDYISVVIFDDTCQVIIPSMPALDPGGMLAESITNPRDAMAIFAHQVQSAVAEAVRKATLILRLRQQVAPKKAVKVLPIIQHLGGSVLSDRQVVIRLGDLENDNAPAVL